MLRLSTLCSALLLLLSCRETPPKDDYLRRAHEFLATSPIVDTHIDFPWHLVEHKNGTRLAIPGMP